MLRRTYLGLSMGADSLRAVALHRQGKSVRLQGARAFDLKPGLLVPAFREANLTDPGALAEVVGEVLDPLSGREDRVALSLPDQAGRVMLVEVETPFKTKQEGRDILRWQLKKSLPSELGDIHLDFQVLSRSDTGRLKVVVALMERGVLDQYQDLLARAGYHAVLVDFQAFNLYNYYRTRVDMGDDFVFVSIQGRVLSVDIFQDRVLVFHRVRDIADHAERVFQELNRTLVGFQGGLQALRRASAYLHTDWQDREVLHGMLSSLFEKETQLLAPHLERLLPQGSDPSALPDSGILDAVGAGERLLWGAG
ncbi:pilus assembly protein PilM [Geoalkalibacter halelectricus]|uniref:Pilus assembly protein PilM n=1 Tax=Geoalkalibacter halelectricus TaxID=2847045 RepID=A0ABY5ZPV0_9BACT|nr:pilus assembly protein PilM [Geoalkalibacter halelectricus]UWZ81177.1 pilus assembly protein PilM [Geoalkalibacter halelectricus]